MSKAEREAFVLGAINGHAWGSAGAEREARKRYPPKTVERERVVSVVRADGYSVRLKVVKGKVMYSIPGVSGWCDSKHNLASAQAIVNLLLSPLETVEVEE